jgi:uncharacterized membrane protein
MTGLLIGLAVVGLLLLGAALAVVVHFLIDTPTDRRRLELMTRQLMAEQRIDAETRATLLAMRDAMRQASRR